jgi:hypothetical protein
LDARIVGGVRRFGVAARGALHLLVTAPFPGLAGAFAVLGVAGDVGVGIAALVWPDPTLLSRAVLVGSWAILRASVGGTIAVTTPTEETLGESPHVV